MGSLLFERMLQIIKALNQHDVHYKIVGALAMNLNGVIRATEDMDLFIEPARDNIDRLKAALFEVWADPCISEIRYEDLAGDYPSVAYGPPDEQFMMDILTRLGEAFNYQSIESHQVLIMGVPVCIATPRMLYKMKHDTVRPQDRVDADRIRSKFALE